MLRQLSIEQITIEAPAAWAGSTDRFRRLLEVALQQELQRVQRLDALPETTALYLDLPPIVVEDFYDLQATARTVAQRIVQGALGQHVTG